MLYDLVNSETNEVWFMSYSKIHLAIASIALSLAFVSQSLAQGAVTLVQPVVSGTPTSSSSPLPVTCISGCSGGGGSSDVNVASVGGNAVTTTIPVSGNVGIPGSTNLATAQVSITTASTQAVAARSGRRSVMITNITGTQPIYCTSGTATTANGQYIPGLAGANLTLPYAGVVNCIAVTSAQTISVAEVY